MSRVRVYALARELHLDSRDLLAYLESIGEVSRSASSIVQDPVARQIRANASEIPKLPPRERVDRAPEIPGRDHDYAAQDRWDHAPANLTTGEAALLLGMTPATVRQWSARGYITSIGKRGRSALYDRDDLVLAWRQTVTRTIAPTVAPVGIIQGKDLDALVTGAEAALIVGASPATIRTWTSRGRLVSVSPMNRRPQLFRVQDVLRAARRMH